MMIALTVERQVGGKKQCAKKKRKKTTKKILVPSAPSIPSKYDESRNEFIEQQETAFLCSTKRFDEKKNANPGPGQYNVKVAKKCGSVSARGYTAMISLDPRFSNLKELESQHLPGPATYTPSRDSVKPSPVKINLAKHNTSGNKVSENNKTTPG